MSSGPENSDQERLHVCAWCGGAIGRECPPARGVALFCSRRCGIEAQFWLYQELCAIEIELGHPRPGDAGHDSP
jgi:hypothetical protein